ncbi:octanoyltransferase [Ureibacillus massiliensis 4400831 = CIP 108448 = CCUG 49529]|uniref:Octanoyl-[GcvH]:protein N-octanoyltransferase n=1 Tax=Ureibacillus massiliensis 4400831 = CIP 108448 = CCUG 49529 TaxID=1211035 RepID=A0A0A3J9G9_9BACL|nr:biotin/lipoate A/B protein ligase family protein [Ureibacillus massiliensis]KGR92430.1 octanoyltransferase [Ureibacillus massiliensis 4400831 = CIP 108448 = CCUG 49529]
MNQLLNQNSWRFIDQSISFLQRTPLESFAMDDTLCHIVGQGMSAPTVRTWVHENSVVLGIQDHRLPYIQDGIEWLESNDYKAIVRNSGGLAVVLDSGVLNISLVLSENEQSISINNGYEAMVDLIKMLFPEVADQIEAYEIVGSYCPGSYDLSIGGKKFAGISQRRMRQGIAVQIYLCIEGSGSARAELIRKFYQISLKDEKTKFAYPQINPEVMASLSELMNRQLTVYETVLRLQTILQSTGDMKLQVLNDNETEYYTFYMNRVLERNKKMLTLEK